MQPTDAQNSPSAVVSNSPSPPTPEAYARASELLTAGELVAFPTETVYGLAANANDDQAVAKIFAVKNRPQFNPLIVHIPDLETAETYGIFNDTARQLAASFWPGALTLVVKRTPECTLSALVSAGLDTVALRLPAHPVAQKLLHNCSMPLAAPSANISGKISPTTAHHVAQNIGAEIAMIIDGGACSIGIESTIIQCTEHQPILLRPGGITAEAIEAITGNPLIKSEDDADTPNAPGQLKTHYAPHKPLRINAKNAKPNEAFIAFGPYITENTNSIFNLSESGNLTEAAANLFAMLHQADRSDAGSIAVMAVPNTGLGRAINDRLARAAYQGQP